MDGKDVARRLYDDVYNARSVEVLDEIAVRDYDEHSPLPGQGAGLDGLKERVAMLIDALDPRFEIQDIVAEDDRVVVRWTNTGTHVGDFGGMPASGRRFTIDGIDVYRLREGKLAEHWHVVDMLGLLQQLGFLPAPESVSG